MRYAESPSPCQTKPFSSNHSLLFKPQFVFTSLLSNNILIGECDNISSTNYKSALSNTEKQGIIDKSTPTVRNDFSCNLVREYQSHKKVAKLREVGYDWCSSNLRIFSTKKKYIYIEYYPWKYSRIWMTRICVCKFQISMAMHDLVFQ